MGEHALYDAKRQCRNEEDMYIIVGLGNPENKYAGTRHNIGFSAITALADANGISVDTKKHKALIGKGVVGGQKVILAMPQTYMNLSGESVRELVDYYKIDPTEQLIIIYDDIALPPGKLRVRPKGTMALRISSRIWEDRNFPESASAWGKSPRDGIWWIMCWAAFPRRRNPRCRRR